MKLCVAEVEVHSQRFAELLSHLRALPGKRGAMEGMTKSIWSSYYEHFVAVMMQ